MTLLPIEKFILSYRRKNSPKVRGCTHGYHLFLSSSVDDSASVCSGCSFRSSFSLFYFSSSRRFASSNDSGSISSSVLDLIFTLTSSYFDVFDFVLFVYILTSVLYNLS